MENKTETKTKTSGFIQMSLATLQAINRMDGGYNELAAYIVLCGGVNGRHAGRYCTHGAKSVSGRSGMSYRTAEKAIEWLHEHGLIRPPSETEPKFLGKTATRAHTVRWVLGDSEAPDVAVSRQFVDGVKGSQKDSPLKRMLAEIGGKDDITRGQAVSDAIVLFAALMKEQDFAECAGVDPDAWHSEFVPVTEKDVLDDSEHIVPVRNTNAVMVTVKESADDLSTLPFVYKVFDEKPKDEQRKKELTNRFWHGVHQLRSLRLIYRVLILWQGNPLDAKQRRKAEPIATQYINDSWAREIDPHLQYEVNRAAWRSGAKDAYADFSASASAEFGDGYLPFLKTGAYRYMVNAKSANSTHLVGQLRVRYWAANESTVQGRQIEKNRTEKFESAIKQIARPL
jgi:hypothetical protein